MEYDLRNTIACLLQSCDHLENRGSEDNKMSRRMWEAGETKAEKARIAKIKKRRKERRGREKARREGTEKGERKEEEKIKEKDSRYRENNRRVGNIE